MNTLDEFTAWVREGVEEYDFASNDFPFVYEDSEGDRVEFILCDEERYAERVDGRLTVYRGCQTGEIVGGTVKGIRRLQERLLREFSGFAFLVKDGKIRLEIIITAVILREDDQVLSMHYQNLAEKLRLHEVTVSACTKDNESSASLCV